MHPTVMAALATERHAELLRTAEGLRRFAVPTQRSSRPFPGGATRTVSRAVARLRHQATPSWQSVPDACCA